jgi:ribosomal subunit interface protein
MAEAPGLLISWKDVDADERLREAVERRCRALGEEFPELTRIEVTLAADGVGHAAHVRVRGRDTEADAHGTGSELRQAADAALDKAERHLRRVHDKRIFARRRDAQKSHPRRTR